MKQRELTNLIKVAKEVKKQVKLWKDLKRYVGKKMSGKTLAKGLKKEINWTIKERENFLKNILKEIK